jgi:hypothetical protein
LLNMNMNLPLLYAGSLHSVHPESAVLRPPFLGAAIVIMCAVVGRIARERGGRKDTTVSTVSPATIQ